MSEGVEIRRVREGEIEHKRKLHTMEDGFCLACGSVWPCDTRIVLDEVERLKRLLKEVR